MLRAFPVPRPDCLCALLSSSLPSVPCPSHASIGHVSSATGTKFSSCVPLVKALAQSPENWGSARRQSTGSWRVPADSSEAQQSSSVGSGGTDERQTEG